MQRGGPSLGGVEAVPWIEFLQVGGRVGEWEQVRVVRISCQACACWCEWCGL